MSETVAVIAAHPDDEVLGCGGVMHRHVRRGDRVHVLILGQGVVSREPSDVAEQLDRLREAGRRSAGLLGVESIRFDDLPDNRFDRVDLLAIVKQVEHYLQSYAPTTVYTHHVGDLNIDHQLTARAVLTATRPVPGMPVRRLLGFEVASSTGWSFGGGPVFDPNVLLDITDHLDAKLGALACYQQEMAAFPHARSVEAVRACAQWRGSIAGVPAAEAFALMRELG